MITSVVKGQERRGIYFTGQISEVVGKLQADLGYIRDAQQPGLIGMHETSASGHSASLIHPPSPFALACSHRSTTHSVHRVVDRLHPVYLLRTTLVYFVTSPRNFAGYLLGSLLSSLTATSGGKMERVPGVPSPWRGNHSHRYYTQMRRPNWNSD